MQLTDVYGDVLTLVVTGYQFPDAPDPGLRYSWHMIAGSAYWQGDTWNFRAPALTCDETPMISQWLRTAAAWQETRHTEPPAELTFTEPNLSFHVAGPLADDLVTIEVQLRQEFAAPRDRVGGGYPTRLRLTSSPDDLRLAAAVWDEERSPYPDASSVDIRVGLLIDGDETHGTLTVEDVEPAGGQAPGISLALTAGDLRWTAIGPDGFAALRKLRATLDRSRIRIGVEGARPNAWASSGQREAGRGLTVQLLRIPPMGGRLPYARTFAPIPVNEAGSIAEQDAFQREWNVQSGHP